MTVQTSRRGFLRASAGLVIAMALPLPMRVMAQEAAAPSAANPPPIPPNAFVQIAPDDTVTVVIKHIEFGQGPLTGLATLVAEELDADWAQMRGALAPANTPLYANLLMGAQGTGGSTAIANSFVQMRRAGAQARAMLVAAAAAEWGVPAAEITVAKGRIAHPSGKESGFGAFAEAAAQQTAPEAPTLKTPDQWVLIGTDLPKLDTAEKSDGKAIFTLDQYPEGLQVVVVAHPDVFGAKVGSVDDTAALAVAGVKAVRTIPQGVAVYADNTFAALKGRKALKVTWDTSGAETRDSAALLAAHVAALDGELHEAEAAGDLAAMDAPGVTVVEAEYSFPFLAHAPMETLDGVITLGDGKAHAAFGSQFPTFDQPAIAQTLGLPPEAVTIDVMLAGGSFGRRATPDAHLAVELAEVAKAGGPGSYKLMWTREDDIRGGYYRPMSVHRFRGAVDAEGKIVGWQNLVATKSIAAGSPMEPMMVRDGVDSTSVEGSIGLPYALPNKRIALANVETLIPVLWWRSVGSSHTAFATEMFMDELLQAAGKDPVQGRLDLLPDGREKVVIQKVAEMAGWKGAKQGEKGYGIGYAKSFGTYVAQIAEVEDRGTGYPHVTRVWCAVDCGIAVNPNIVRAQMEGGIGFGLGTALFNAVRFGEGGHVVQSNFNNYRMLRIAEMPRVEVEIIKTDADPTGVGEPGVPPIGPAVANAWRALTGKATRALPMLSEEIA
ncbi:xanthine dehydrogenase family protein molybdopterin-binding subunit [Paracoccus suum]|uniref:Xanthine dehydrogenase family protein molybdopterin-binding subunit n=1 Tax=Paracoccus suum TaxID=2259340 RepID=A0A344PMS9_9RHOB|nr:molybdopterin cofactor-binding domain-containing protein [Paracoccus suum]AXC50684.1 xanthine dehydrogenase family protein molybdopterin-binding subunit [Paracoccus suum]